MEIKKAVIFTDENTIVIDNVLGISMECEHMDRTDCVFDLTMTYRHENARYIPDKVYILQKEGDGFCVYDRKVRYDISKSDDIFEYDSCPYEGYSMIAMLKDIIWHQDTSDKVYEKFKKDGCCICATKEIAEAYKSIFEKKMLEEYVVEVETEFVKLQEKFEEMKKHVI